MIIPSISVGSEDVGRHYDALDSTYRSVWGEHLHHGLWDKGIQGREDAVLELVHRVAEWADLREGQSVCDVGCGYGATARLLAEEYDVKVLGLTLSEAQLRVAIERSQQFVDVSFKKMDWLKNDLPDSSFDHLISIESSEHMPDKSRFFSEAFRVLRPGGTLVVCAWLACESPSAWQTGTLLEPICREGRLPSLGSEIEYLDWMRDTGFDPEIRFEDLTSRVKKTWSLAIGGFAKYLLKDPRRISLLLPRKNPEATFALTPFRIRAAYEIGVMRYGIFCARKPRI